MDEAIRRSIGAVCRDGEYHLYKAKAVLEPLLAKRWEEQAADTVLSDETFDNLLQLMDNAATGSDKLAGRPLVLTFASSHTTSIAVCQTLFQICEHPEYIFELREEVRDVVEGDFKVAFSKIDGAARRFQREIHQSTDGLDIFVLLDVPSRTPNSVSYMDERG